MKGPSMRTREQLLVHIEDWVDRLVAFVNHYGDVGLERLYDDMADVWVEEQEGDWRA